MNLIYPSWPCSYSPQSDSLSDSIKEINNDSPEQLTLFDLDNFIESFKTKIDTQNSFDPDYQIFLDFPLPDDNPFDILSILIEDNYSDFTTNNSSAYEIKASMFVEKKQIEPYLKQVQWLSNNPNSLKHIETMLSISKSLNYLQISNISVNISDSDLCRIDMTKILPF